MRDPDEKVSYIIRAKTQVYEAVSPFQSKFTEGEIRRMVGGRPEFLAKTTDGYAMYAAANRFEKTNMINERATLLYVQANIRIDVITGDVLLCHPQHVGNSLKQVE